MSTIDSTLGGKASTYGWYSQITSSTYDGSQLLEVLNDVVSSGAVFQPAIMPTIPFSEVTSSVASQVASVLEQFTSKGVEVWLRFGHEMNYYVVSNAHGQGLRETGADQNLDCWHLLGDPCGVHYSMEEHPRSRLRKLSHQDVLVPQHPHLDCNPVFPWGILR